MSDPRTAENWRALDAMIPGTVGGWMTEAEYNWLMALARAMQPSQRMLEIGIFQGTTVSLFAFLAPESCEIIGMDSWENQTICTDGGERVSLRTFCMRNLERNGLTERVRIIEGSSHEYGPQWKLPLDVLIIDGDHTMAGALQDLLDYAKWVTPGGWLIIDDYWSASEVSDAVRAWRIEYPPDEWTHAWGWTDTWAAHAAGNLNPDVHKMVVYRRRGEACSIDHRES